MIYFISDFHFGHKNIIEYGGRPFASVEEMNEAMISNYNEGVGSDDTVYIVGDFCLGALENIRDYLSRFRPVKKRVLIKGNHDRIKNLDEARSVGFDDMVNRLVLEHEGLRIGLSHYPFRPAGEMPGKSEFLPSQVDLLIHGHVHQLYRSKIHDSGVRMVNVSVEVINYRPISLPDALGR